MKKIELTFEEHNPDCGSPKLRFLPKLCGQIPFFIYMHYGKTNTDIFLPLKLGFIGKDKHVAES